MNRRTFLGMSAGAAAMGLAGTRPGFAQQFPSHTMNVVIPTGEGGGVDRAARAFTSVWQKHLGANFEFGYFPGASGQVGYEVYVGKREPDAHNLLFGNIGPEMIVYATQDTSYTYPDDYIYFAGIDVDDSAIWVAANSELQTIEDLVEAGKQRTINISTSRLPHPSSLGVLALGEATGADFRLIPYGGGSAARTAAITGEVEACATFLGSSLGLDDQIRFLTVFQNRNRLPNLTNDAPPVNEALGTQIPALSGTRAWAIHRAAAEEYPDRFEKLKETSRAAFEDPAYRQEVEQSKLIWEFAEYSDEEACAAEARATMELAERYKDVLSGNG
ncbi:Bug family tripartite tricarboxylate transporter substrate binding protein [Lutibaculum baratangense]|uniref:Putative extra-cytoplasmic solute receptor n=1 Tax=Lutibaculum baratangense AMV1 TaxID=631454 RepID=V4RHC4_9HYPH|nr:tripartite tricarboxylate transporter substrate-binding protein [Lutibaculum baratangense]ESR22680.1 putative extra-cytoplasmic solute receptor [Lutibaculum baratangense AMV1]